MKDIVYLDLFSGIGGFPYGFEQAGLKIKTHYFSEIDKNAIAIYKYQFKNSIYVGSVENVSGIERPNLITFGFPCQDLSIAGKREGLNGARSGLFFQALRLIELYKPEIFIFENVKGLLSSNNGKDFETVLRSIADIGIYECEWQLVNTRWLLPQNRERIYFVGHLAGRSKSRVFPFRENDFRTDERKTETSIIGTLTAGGHSGGMHSGMTLLCDSGKGRKIEERKIIAPLRANTGAGHGNYVHYGNSQDQKISINVSQTLNAGHYNVPKVAVKRAPLKFLDRNQKNIKGDYSFTIDGANTGGLNVNGNIRRLTEIECERLQGFPDDWTKYGLILKKSVYSYIYGRNKQWRSQRATQNLFTHAVNKTTLTKAEISKTARYQTLGNAVTTLWPKLIMQRLINEL